MYRAARDLAAGPEHLGTGIDVGDLIRDVSRCQTGLPVLHIGSDIPAGLPADVPTLPEPFTPDELLLAVKALMPAVAHSTPPG